MSLPKAVSIMFACGALGLLALGVHGQNRQHASASDVPEAVAQKPPPIPLPADSVGSIDDIRERVAMFKAVRDYGYACDEVADFERIEDTNQFEVRCDIVLPKERRAKYFYDKASGVVLPIK